MFGLYDWIPLASKQCEKSCPALDGLRQEKFNLSLLTDRDLMSQIGKGNIAVNALTLAQKRGGVKFEIFLCASGFGGCYNVENMTPDSELLAAFERSNSEDAFAELVRRHVNLVYSVALRLVNADVHLAQDVTQSVFADLARKAHALSRRDCLSSWLYTSACYAAAKAVRTESRRRDREDKFMREAINDTGTEAEWETIRPVLDNAMLQLKEADRQAILLRFFENRSFAEVGLKLGLNENAARMRVDRALEKLRGIFARREVATSSALAAAISAHAVQVAPTGLTTILTTASITTSGTTTFTLLKIMTATQLKLGIGVLVVAGAATVLVFQHQTQGKLRNENESLTQQLMQLKRDNEMVSNQLANATHSGGPPVAPDGPSNELLKLRGENAVLRQQAKEADEQASDAGKKLAAALSSQAQFAVHENNTINATKQLGLAIRLFAADNQNQYPTNVQQLASELGGKYTIGGIDLFSLEFVNIGMDRSGHPNMVELRERLAQQAPDGTWRRIYGFADGSVQTAISNDGDFEAWEKVNTYSPPPNQ